VKSAKISDPATWYKSDKRFIVAATSADSSYPWWTALRWAENIREQINETVRALFIPPNKGTVNDGSAYTNKKGSNYGCGEPLNKYTANTEVFHTCDLTVAVNVWTVPDFQSRWVKVSYPSTGKTRVLRVNDYGPDPDLNRAIDFTCRGSTKALGVYVTDTPVTFQFQK
jgi:rare lipoprotein A (peptidoglycan hydrolase)